LTAPILEDDRIEDLPAKDASPPVEKLPLAVEFLVDQVPATPMTSHDSTLLASSHIKSSRPFFSTLIRLNFPLKDPASKYCKHCISPEKTVYFWFLSPEEVPGPGRFRSL
jgi:hypothetical protein